MQSNPILVSVVDPVSVGAKAPPFVVSIRDDPDFGASEKLPLLICMVNISDRDIRLDNAITKDVFVVTDRTGKSVGLTKAGRDLERQFGSTGITTGSVRPGGSLCGVVTIADLFDFASPGDYTVRVDRYDEPDALPNQPLRSLPIVKSNTAKLTVSLDNERE